MKLSISSMDNGMACITFPTKKLLRTTSQKKNTKYGLGSQ